MNPIPSVGVLIIQNNKVLLVKHRKGAGNIEGIYGLPAGRIESGEDPKDTAVRELQEETGLTALPNDLVSLGREWKAVIKRKEGPKEFTILVFRCNTFQGTLAPSDETIPVWIDINKIDGYPLLPNMKEIIMEGGRL
ncbi:MAG: NUDIX hydrolase [Patescibacteria group bacterium]|jgi:8-oxo-dGTP pyrophosphatase MutT (NUDIX family)